MDLSKDNRNIYTVDSESYSKEMEDNWKEPSDVLGSFIKILLVILLIVLGYFFYKIIKADLSFSEVFNKKELLATYEFFNTNEKVYDVKEDYVEALAVKIVPEPSEIKRTVLSVSKKHNEVVTPKKEKVPEVLVESVVEVPTVEVMISKEEASSTVVSETYLDRMVEELNSL